MSVQRADSQPSYPVTTTTTTDSQYATITTTTTTTTTGAHLDTQTAISQPNLGTRRLGQHAKALRLNWTDPSDHSQYLEKTGLPEIHAAVLNDDWEVAEKILHWKDISVLWRSATSRESSWLNRLSSSDEHQRQSAITDLAATIVSNTRVEGTGCVHGSNLLTLALQKGAPIAFLKKLVQLTEKNAFSNLSFPDASGRTPLYIAVERGDEEQVALLLEAGANPHILCNFQGESIFNVRNSNFIHKHSSEPKPTSAYRLAMQSDKLNIFSLLLEKTLENSKKEKPEWKYPDPILQLKEWAARNDEKAIRELSQRFLHLKTKLFNLKDCTGTSIVYRQLNNRQPLDTGIKVITDINPNDWPIYKAAETQDIKTFFCELEILLINDYRSIDHLLGKIFRAFVENNSEENIRLLVEKFPAAVEFYKGIILNDLQESKLSYKKFSLLLKPIWQLLCPDEQNEIFRPSEFENIEYINFILSLSNLHFHETS